MSVNYIDIDSLTLEEMLDLSNIIFDKHKQDIAHNTSDPKLFIVYDLVKQNQLLEKIESLTKP